MDERRQGMEELKKKIDIALKEISHMRGYLESEFGGHNSLSGLPTEGNMNRRLREYNEEKNAILKRIEILEKKSILFEKLVVYGSGFLAAFAVSFEVIKVFIAWFKK